jgi:hypothetical protein
MHIATSKYVPNKYCRSRTNLWCMLRRSIRFHPSFYDTGSKVPGMDRNKIYAADFDAWFRTCDFRNSRQDLPFSLSFDSLHASDTRKLSTLRRLNSVCTVGVYKYSLRMSQRKTGNSVWSNVTTSGHQPDRLGVKPT